MKKSYLIPISIVVLGLLVAGSIYLINHSGGSQQGSILGGGSKVPAVTADDHILGNPQAPIKIVEYADLECPYCKQFELTMQQIMQYYGPSGKVAWIFRNFPLTPIHKQAAPEAAAAECAAQQGGSAAFFKFIDKIYENTPGEDGLDMTQIPNYSQQVGLDPQKMQQCTSAGTFTAKVDQQYKDALATGAQGTPHIVIMVNDQATITLDGNQPYASMRAAIDQILQSTGNAAATTTPAAQ